MYFIFTLFNFLTSGIRDWLGILFLKNNRNGSNLHSKRKKLNNSNWVYMKIHDGRFSYH